MAMIGGRQIRFYIVREHRKLAIHEKTDFQMSEWLTANPHAELAANSPFDTHEEARKALDRASSN